MKQEVVFYLAHQHGDIISSKQYVRYIIDQLGDGYDFYYIHEKNPESIFIHEKVTVINCPIYIHDIPMDLIQNYYRSLDKFSNAIWLDAWVGSLNGCKRIVDSNGYLRFVVPDKEGNYDLDKSTIFDNVYWQQKICNQNIDLINQYFFLMNFSFKIIKYPQLEDVINKGNSNPKKKVEADCLISKINNFKLKIFIANSHTESIQRPNFFYEEYLENLFDKYVDVAFVLSNNYKNVLKNNVFYVDNYVPIPNLNEIEYLSSFMNILVTSASGPGMIVLNTNVFNDPSKTLIYFKQKIMGLYYPDGLCKYVESENYERENIVNIIEENLKEKLS